MIQKESLGMSFWRGMFLEVERKPGAFYLTVLR